MEQPVKLRIGVGEEEGFANIPAAELGSYGDETIEQVYLAFSFHRWTRNQRFRCMDEIFRVLKPGGQVSIVCPHANSLRAISDPEAQWPPICESSFMVYSKTWREQEGMTYLPLTCDFGAAYGYGHQFDPEVAVRNDEYRAQAVKHWNNAVTDLHVTLTKPVDA